MTPLKLLFFWQFSFFKFQTFLKKTITSRIGKIKKNPELTKHPKIIVKIPYI